MARENHLPARISAQSDDLARTRYEPRDLEQGYQLAQRIASTGLVPGPLRGKPDDVFLVMAQGAELGLTTMQSLRGLHVIDGRVTLSADLMVALCLSHSSCEFFRCVKQTEEGSVWEAKRRGSTPQTVSFTSEDARRAGLTGRAPWKSYPARMCSARAKAFLARDVFPDVVGGFHTPDEMGRDQVDDPAIEQFCVCGRGESECDGSRDGCVRNRSQPNVQSHLDPDPAGLTPSEDMPAVSTSDEVRHAARQAAEQLLAEYPSVVKHLRHAQNAIQKMRKERFPDDPLTVELVRRVAGACRAKYEAKTHLQVVTKASRETCAKEARILAEALSISHEDASARLWKRAVEFAGSKYPTPQHVVVALDGCLEEIAEERFGGAEAS